MADVVNNGAINKTKWGIEADKLNAKFNSIDLDMLNANADIAIVNGRLDGVDSDLTTVNGRLDDLQSKQFDTIALILKQQDSSLIFQGFAKPADDTPTATENHAYYVIESGNVFGVEANEGQVLVSDGNGFEVQSLEEKVGHDELAQLADDVEQLAYVKIKNEAVNGNFENGLIESFGRSDGSGSESTLDINSSSPISGNYDIRFTITTPATEPHRPIFRGLNGAANIGDKIYLHFYAKILSGTPKMHSIGDGVTNNSIYGGDVINGRNTRIIDVARSDSSSGLIYFDTRAVWDMQMDNFIRINLTETFGAGNEPTEEEMNLLLDTLAVEYSEGEYVVPQEMIFKRQLALIKEKASHGYETEEPKKTLKQVDDEVSQLADDVKLLTDTYTGIDFSEEKTPAQGSRATWRIPISNNKLPITVTVDLISGDLVSANWSIYYMDESSAIAFMAFNNIPYGESITFYLPDEYIGIYVFCRGNSVDGTATNKVTFMQESLADVVNKNKNEIDNIKGDIAGLETSIADANAVRYLPQNVFGNVLPKSFKSKYFGGEQDVEIVCVGDSLTGNINGCTAFTTEEQQHLPPGLTTNHWTYQLWNRLNLNKPLHNRIDTDGIFAKVGVFNLIIGGKFNEPSKNGEYSDSALTFENTDLNASAQFSWDLDLYRKCNLIYSANQDGAISEIIIGGGNGLIEVSVDKTTWQEANGFEVNQNTIPSGSTYTEATAYQFGIALHQRHRRIWMRAKDTATGVQSITYRRKSTDTDPLHYFYFWGTEMWNQQSLFLTNIGRGGRNTDLLNCNLTDVSDRKPDLLIYAMPLANETNKVNFSEIKPYYYSYFFSETSNNSSVKIVSNNFQDFDVMMVMPHGRSAYFDGNQAVHYESTPIEPVFNHIYMKSVFSYVEGLSENYKDQFANINLMEQLYNEGFARGLTLEEWLAGGNMTADGIHLNDLGSTLWAKYLAPIFQ